MKRINDASVEAGMKWIKIEGKIRSRIIIWFMD